MSGNLALLRSLTAPLDKYKTPGVTEIMINRPHEVWTDDQGQMIRHEDESLTPKAIEKMARVISGNAGQQINELKPLLSTTLPKHQGRGGERIQIVHEPAVEPQRMAIVMRIPGSKNIGYDDYKSIGAFDTVKAKKPDEILRQLYEAKNWHEFIRQAVLSKKNIINSGGTSTGKTTFTNALLSLIPSYERLITIEDARELKIEHENKVHLLTKSEKRDDKNNIIVPEISATELIQSCLRMRPDRIIQGELRGKEAFAYLRGINTGHPGSISTVHADTPTNAINQLCLMVMQAEMGWNVNDIRTYVKSVVDVVIQWKKVDNRRFISDILWVGKDE